MDLSDPARNRSRGVLLCPTSAVDVQDIGRSGLVATYTTGLTLLDRYLFNNDGRTIVHVLEASGTATDVTVVTPGMVDGLAVADRVVTVRRKHRSLHRAIPAERLQRLGTQDGPHLL